MTEGVLSSMEYDEEDAGAGDEEFTDTYPDVANEYSETAIETASVRCCGACWCVVLAVCILTWIVHAIPIATVTDIPPFARSALWLSLAHHTDAWQSYRGSVSPPPPQFGDGAGVFPDANR